MADEPEDIDFEQIVWDPRYRRTVIERLNRTVREPAASATAPEEPESGLVTRR